MSRIYLRCLILIISVFMTSGRAVQAAEGTGERSPADIASLMCDSCHAARGVGRNNFPVLAGQNPVYLVKQLRDFRSGKRVDATMEALAEQLSDQEIDLLAHYYASHRDALCW